MELNLGHLLTLKTASSVKHQFQNFRISGSVTYSGVNYSFAPFRFTGIVANLSGDNMDASLVFPANKLTRAWAEEALQESWIGTVRVMLLDDNSVPIQQLHSYVGVIASGGWDTTAIELQLNTVMNAVRGSIPGRKFTRQLVGNIPITANIRV
jgi:hypothetical protein